ncbi:hypothetical protein EDD85DRAFT_797845 [Armillaria nabsnona]|nr:hypothetical protein EDD85DRAFT_797845 [Armillaria nabsnona]
MGPSGSSSRCSSSLSCMKIYRNEEMYQKTDTWCNRDLNACQVDLHQFRFCFKFSAPVMKNAGHNKQEGLRCLAGWVPVLLAAEDESGPMDLYELYYSDLSILMFTRISSFGGASVFKGREISVNINLGLNEPRVTITETRSLFKKCVGFDGAPNCSVTFKSQGTYSTLKVIQLQQPWNDRPEYKGVKKPSDDDESLAWDRSTFTNDSWTKASQHCAKATFALSQVERLRRYLRRF